MKPEAYETYVIFGEGGKLPEEELLGRCSDYARLALMYYQRKRLLRAIFWAAMASAASAFEAAYISASWDSKGTRSGQVGNRKRA